ncbi:MAG: CBS domain-containing protein [Planctomycetota bacterium]|jgi:predicted transcriptional regulator
MPAKFVRDIMVPLEEYPCIPHTLTLRDAIEEMAVQILRQKQATLPRVVLVFDDDFCELLGVLRRRDIMRGLEPGFLVSGSLDYSKKLFNIEADPNLAELSFDRIVAHIRQRASRPVREVMSPIKATVNHDDHITKAIYEMVNKNASMLPVLKDGEIVGVLRSVEVLGELALLMNP